MIKHYLTIAFRNLWKYKVQNLIGIAGLAIGISFFTLGYHWIERETSYDSFHPDADRIYRVYAINKKTGKPQDRMPMVLAEMLKKEFPEIEITSQYFTRLLAPAFHEERELGIPKFLSVDEHFLELFPPKIIAGKTDNLLQTTEELIITEDFARKYWDSPEEAIGAVLETKSPKSTNIVTAVMANFPENSNFQGGGIRQDIFSRRFYPMLREDRVWKQKNCQIYVLLNKSVDPLVFENKLRNYVIDNQYNEDLILQMTPITEMRHTLGSDLSFNISYIRTFVGAGLLLMFCALFNFLNLYINRMLQRKREVKLRKTVGANNFSVIKLFQTDLLLQLILAFVFSSLLLLWLIPFFEQRFETVIIKPELQTQYLIVIALTFVLMFIFCILAEWRFARFSTLTHSPKTGNYKFLRSISICIQLAICVFFIMSAAVFYKQVNMMNQFDWGFNPKGLIEVTVNPKIKERKLITQEIAELSVTKQFIGTNLWLKREPWFHDDPVESNGKEIMKPIYVFEDCGTLIDVFEVPLLQGRVLGEGDGPSFGYERGVLKRTSTQKAVITESLYKLLEKEDVIGDVLRVPFNGWSSDGRATTNDVEIVGVIKDFHITGLQNETYPIVLKYEQEKWGWEINFVRVEEGREEEAIAAIKRVFDKYTSDDSSEVPEIKLVSDILNDINKSENASLQLFLLLALLCVIIAIFGIYSISSSNMERRKREIAIRKVSGATVMQIVSMFLVEYSRLLVVANLLALPLAYYFMQNWLSTYVYRTSIDYWLFLFVFAFTLAIVILTVLAQVIRAANANLLDIIKSQ